MNQGKISIIFKSVLFGTDGEESGSYKVLTGKNEDHI